ncbi:MAG: hypothetical protein A3E84_00685 [Gammaproteobacteria bacterium RIFCSPHIGHO2_12_FULL_42_13]|nr:MAG: hypothetical protein A3E84_00685 [Gammaproteobacteria bacterium RIFCSPHIGHO2_12_FULL_42_13]
MRVLWWVIGLGLLLVACSKTPQYSGSSITLPPPPDTTNKNAQAIYAVLPVYANAARYAWKPIQTTTPMRLGRHYTEVPEIRDRLITLNDLPKLVASASTLYDATLAQGITRFQMINDLPATGRLDQDTLTALNISPVARYNTLLHSMHQWMEYPQDSGSRYILVNIPAYQLQLVEHGYVMWKSPVIVGRPTRPTPMLSSNIVTVVFNPTWTVPKTILSRDVIPGMQKNPNYLHEHYDMRVYANCEKDAAEIDASTIDWQNMRLANFPYCVRAPAGEKNPLGRIKFIFGNKYDVYLHDTPEKSIFNLSKRVRSSGCIRLENPQMLVHYFGFDNDNLKPELVVQYLSTLDTKQVGLKNPMPIYIVYILNWVDSQGRVIFGKNIYENGVVPHHLEPTTLQDL